MQVVVAGGTGFVGRHVVAALRAAGHTVVIPARSTRQTAPLSGVEYVRWDAAIAPPPLAALRAAGALINLIGIKREAGAQTFEQLHVTATARLLAAAREAGVPRFVHLSVVASRSDADSPYHDTKWRAEQLIRASDRAWTILRPSVIYGRGDDLVTNLVKAIRFTPLLPLVGDGSALLQPIAVDAVAAAIVHALERDATYGQTYDLLGPCAMPLRDLVRTVAAGLRLSVTLVEFPLALQRAAVRLMDATMREPLATPAQLRMLTEGMAGDPQPAYVALDIAPPAFTAQAVEPLAADLPPLFGITIRLVADVHHQAWLHARRALAGRAAVLAALAIPLLWLLAALVPNVWSRMLVFYALLVPLAVASQPVGWHQLLTPHRRPLLIGAGAAVALYGLGWAGFHLLLAALPVLAGEVAALYGWRDQLPAPAFALFLLPAIVAAEELVWRGALTLPLAARWGAWRGVLLGAVLFGAAHLAFGSALLVLAAVVCGAYWGALAIATRSLVPSLVCHLLWDAAVMFWLPY
jgi:uncharacterized protein YbjT (DUF2867 family)/membrane protease YdiL (CAAX protease family)